MPYKNSRNTLHGGNAPDKGLKYASNKSRNKIPLQNRFLDQGKSFQKLLKFRTLFCLPCILHLNMVCFT